MLGQTTIEGLTAGTYILSCTEVPDYEGTVEDYTFTLGYDSENNKVICGSYTLSLFLGTSLDILSLDYPTTTSTTDYDGGSAEDLEHGSGDTNDYNYVFSYVRQAVSVNVVGLGNPPAVTIETDDNGNETLYIYNSSTYDLPLTGLFGTSNFYKVGTILIVFGLCVIVIAKLRLRKRKVSVSKIRSLKKSVYNARTIINNWNKEK